MSDNLRHIPTTYGRAYCGAALTEYHATKPGLPQRERVACAKCLALAYKSQAQAQGWKVKIANV